MWFLFVINLIMNYTQISYVTKTSKQDNIAMRYTPNIINMEILFIFIDMANIERERESWWCGRGHRKRRQVGPRPGRPRAPPHRPPPPPYTMITTIHKAILLI